MTTWDSQQNPHWDPDALVRFSLRPSSAGGRSSPAFNGYRPHYRVKPDYLTSTSHFFVDCELVEPGSEADAFVKFATPDAYPNSLSLGQVIEVCEGSRVVGQAVFQEIFNESLLAG